MAISPAISAALGHQPTPEECAAFQEPLSVVGADSLDGIESFTSLEQLQLLGCDLDSLDAVARLPKLKALQVLCTPVKDLSPLCASKTLLELEVNFTFVEDLSPLLEIPQLHWLRLYGNPLSDHSFYEVVTQLRQRPIPGWDKPPTVEVSGESEWQMARKIWDAGIRRSYGFVPRTRKPTLVRPGRGTEGVEVDFFEYSFEGMEKALANPKFADYGMFHKNGTKDAEDVQRLRERFCASWLAGNHRDACIWVEQDFDVRAYDDERNRYYSFIGRFHPETFFLDRGYYLDEMERKHRVKFPAWFRRVRTLSLAGVRPTAPSVEMEFEKFSERSITRTGGRYKIGFLGYYNSEDRALFHDKCGMFPIGDITTGRDLGQSMLAINLRNSDDRRIYEFRPPSISHEANDPGLMDLFSPVFGSWGELLAATTAIVVGDEVVPART